MALHPEVGRRPARRGARPVDQANAGALIWLRWSSPQLGQSLIAPGCQLGRVPRCPNNWFYSHEEAILPYTPPRIAKQRHRLAIRPSLYNDTRRIFMPALWPASHRYRISELNLPSTLEILVNRFIS